MRGSDCRSSGARGWSRASVSSGLSPLQSALLGIVATCGRSGIPRGRLLSLLWRMGTDAQLRRRLSQLVYSFRKRLSGKTPILAVGDHYLLDSENVISDLDRLTLALRTGALRTAVLITEKGFLSNLGCIPTPDLEKWIQERESGLRSDVRTRAATAWREAEQTTDWAAAEEAADILLRLDPGNERVLRGLLRARALLGKPQEADATFAEFRDQMRPLDPHWEPEEETALLVMELENVANADQHLTAKRSSSFEAPSLVGREHELRWLLSHIRDSSARPVHPDTGHWKRRDREDSSCGSGPSAGSASRGPSRLIRVH